MRVCTYLAQPPDVPGCRRLHHVVEGGGGHGEFGLMSVCRRLDDCLCE